MFEVTVAVTINENSSTGTLISAASTETIAPMADMGDVLGLFLQVRAMTTRQVEDVQKRVLEIVDAHAELAKRGKHPFQE